MVFHVSWISRRPLCISLSMASKSNVRSHIHSCHQATTSSFMGYASNNQRHSPLVHFSMKCFRIFFHIDSGGTTDFHLVMSMWNTSYPSFNRTTLMATNRDAKRSTTSLLTNGVHQSVPPKVSSYYSTILLLQSVVKNHLHRAPCQSFPGNSQLTVINTNYKPST
jgi:hypothetical protein